MINSDSTVSQQTRNLISERPALINKVLPNEITSFILSKVPTSTHYNQVNKAWYYLNLSLRTSRKVAKFRKCIEVLLGKNERATNEYMKEISILHSSKSIAELRQKAQFLKKKILDTLEARNPQDKEDFPNDRLCESSRFLEKIFQSAKIDKQLADAQNSDIILTPTELLRICRSALALGKYKSAILAANLISMPDHSDSISSSEDEYDFEQEDDFDHDLKKENPEISDEFEKVQKTRDKALNLICDRLKQIGQFNKAEELEQTLSSTINKNNASYLSQFNALVEEEKLEEGMNILLKSTNKAEIIDALIQSSSHFYKNKKFDLGNQLLKAAIDFGCEDKILLTLQTLSSKIFSLYIDGHSEAGDQMLKFLADAAKNTKHGNKILREMSMMLHYAGNKEKGLLVSSLY